MRRQHLLPERPDVNSSILERARRDYDRFARGGWPRPVEDYLLEEYRLDVAAAYAGIPLANPWGKGSGQLSMTAAQVAEDASAGLGLVVLKTVIAQDATGRRSMGDWAIRESRMVVEPIVGRSGETGWTVSWKGRGWWQSFEEYVDLVSQSLELTAAARTLVVPSCKFHLAAEAGEPWRVDEYDFTVKRLLAVWRSARGATAMPLEKDFSPTLAGSDRARDRGTIISWLRTVPRLVRRADPRVLAGLKIFNALDEDEFQVDMLRAMHEAGDDRPDFFVYGNRLFGPRRAFDGHRGIAYGGPDLSDRNCAVLSRFQQLIRRGDVPGPPIPWSATGNIVDGKSALEYALLGASSFQLHTFFQLPSEHFRRTEGPRAEKALHELYFHPETGFIVWMHHLAGALGLDADPVRFHDVVGRGGDVRGDRG